MSSQQFCNAITLPAAATARANTALANQIFSSVASWDSQPFKNKVSLLSDIGAWDDGQKKT